MDAVEFIINVKRIYLAINEDQSLRWVNARGTYVYFWTGRSPVLTHRLWHGGLDFGIILPSKGKSNEYEMQISVRGIRLRLKER